MRVLGWGVCGGRPRQMWYVTRLGGAEWNGESMRRMGVVRWVGGMWVAAAAVLAAGCVAGASAAGRGADAEAQAAEARADLESRAELIAAAAKGQREPEPGQLLVEDVVRLVLDRAAMVKAGFEAQHADEVAEAQPYGANVALIGFDDLVGNAALEESGLAARRLGVRLMARLRDDGVFALMDSAVGACPRNAGNLEIEEGRSGVERIQRYRAYVRLCRARMRLALDAGDTEEFERGLTSGLALVGAVGAGPTMLDWLQASAVRGELRDAMQIVLMTQPDREWVDVLARNIEELRPRDAGAMLAFEQRVRANRVAEHFADADRIRRGLDAEVFGASGEIGEVRAMLGLPMSRAGSDVRLGTYRENRRGVEEGLTALARRVALDPSARPEWPATGSWTGLVLAEALVESAAGISRPLDAERLRWRGVVVMVSLERYRLAHGEYPERLDALPADDAGAGEVDPYSGKRLRYRRLHPADDRLRRPYLLWSVGADGVDDRGGSESPDAGGPGDDIVVNDARR